jgi:hypothetical protein
MASGFRQLVAFERFASPIAAADTPRKSTPISFEG